MLDEAVQQNNVGQVRTSEINHFFTTNHPPFSSNAFRWHPADTCSAGPACVGLDRQEALWDTQVRLDLRPTLDCCSKLCSSFQIPLASLPFPAPQLLTWFLVKVRRVGTEQTAGVLHVCAGWQLAPAHAVGCKGQRCGTKSCCGCCNAVALKHLPSPLKYPTVER